MQETSLHFYHSKIKLFLQIIFFFPLMFGGFALSYIGRTEQSFFVILLGLFIVVVFSFFWGSTILKLLRNYPYITVTNTYIQLDPYTKSEVTIDYDDIISVRVFESSFKKLIRITTHNEAVIFDELSLYNKIRLGPNRLFGFGAFTVAYNAVRKRDRPQLLVALDNIMAYKDRFLEEPDNIDISIDSANLQKDFWKKYDDEPLVSLTIDKAYFKKAYGYSVIIFLCMFILFYLLLDSGNSYLYYIVVSFFAFPFAKLLLDWMGIYKLRQKVDKQAESPYYFEIQMFLDVLLFHASFLIAPFGLLLLLIRYIVRKAR